MNFEEYAAKPLLKAAGITIPDGRYAVTAEDVAVMWVKGLNVFAQVTSELPAN